MDVNTILVPTDFSSDADIAISTAADLAAIFKARIVVLHAYHVDVPMASPMGGGGFVMPKDFYADIRAHAIARVEEVAKGLVSRGIEASSIALPDPASHAIVAEAESLPADLIVLGTRGLTGLKHVVLGSVAERVVRMAPCPVLTVKGKD